jgi:hypothetical protein
VSGSDVRRTPNIVVSFGGERLKDCPDRNEATTTPACACSLHVRRLRFEIAWENTLTQQREWSRRKPRGSAPSRVVLAIGLAICVLGGVGVHDLFVDPDRRLLNSAPGAGWPGLLLEAADIPLMFLGPTVLSIGLFTVGLTAIRTPRSRRRASFILIAAGITVALLLVAGPAIACIATGAVIACKSRVIFTRRATPQERDD